MFEDTFEELLDKYKAKHPSYKLKLTISPEWFEIIRAVAPVLKTNEEINTFAKEHLQYCDEESSLIFKDFSFTAFVDQVSGMTLP